MTLSDIVHYRLINQHIANTSCKSPYEVVYSMGAMQAQDYLGALWAIGLRLPKATEAGIEQEIATRKIIRTWPMRGTLHFVAADDVRWMLKLLTPGIIANSAGIYKQSELTDRIFTRCMNLLTKALEGGKSLTREDLYKVLNKEKISTAGQRGLHILGYLAQKGIICLGNRHGKQHTFVLLDEWIPSTRNMESREEALTEIARRYFKSHGPATLHDFVSWSGLPINDAKISLEMVRSELTQKTCEGQIYWLSDGEYDLKKIKTKTYLLPAFDEFLKGYHDRSAALEARYHLQVILKNGLYNPVIVISGRVLGTWKRSFVKDRVVVETNFFSPIKPSLSKSILTETRRYGRFLGKPAQP